MKQVPITPAIKDCICGAKAVAVDWDFRDRYRVVCDNNHTFMGECNTRHRAICKWNNEILKRKMK